MLVFREKRCDGNSALSNGRWSEFTFGNVPQNYPLSVPYDANNILFDGYFGQVYTNQRLRAGALCKNSA